VLEWNFRQVPFEATFVVPCGSKNYYPGSKRLVEVSYFLFDRDRAHAFFFDDSGKVRKNHKSTIE
jgi:hypothetical protein